MKLFNRLFKRDQSITHNRKVTKARFLYLYVIVGSIVGFEYFIASVILGWPKHFGLTPVYVLLLFFIARFLIKNWRMIWLYIVDVERGKLLLYLEDHTHWTREQKMKVIKWVYLSRRMVRIETKMIISKKVFQQDELTEKEKILGRYRSVTCPQQMKDGWNEAMLVDALIYAHRNIHPLDDELREIMNLTDDHILYFDIAKEAEKVNSKEYQRLMKIGIKKSEELNK